jgi:hypothetical protein
MSARIFRRLGSFFYRRAHEAERRSDSRAITHIGGIDRRHFSQ